VKEVKPWVKFNLIDEKTGQFEVSPLDPGMGNTVGNAIRRVLLSSLTGAAVTFVKIDGINHEFTSIPNVVEDVLDIICNIKGLIFKYDGDDPVTISLTAKGAGKITAKDIKSNTSALQIVNLNHHIVELAAKGSIDIEMIVEKGTGYRPSMLSNPDWVDVDSISLDASFSPIVRANYKVDSIRVGKSLDYDLLTLDVMVNGSISVEDVVKQAIKTLINLFSIFNDLNKKPEEIESEEESGSDENIAALSMSIDDIELSARSSNCLKRAGIQTVGELVSTPISDLIQIKNFGQKSADEINEKLSDYNLSLKETA